MDSHIRPTHSRATRGRANGTAAATLTVLLGLIFLTQVPMVLAGGTRLGDNDSSPEPTQPIPWPSHDPTPTPDPSVGPVLQPPSPEPQPPAPDPVPAPKQTPPPPIPCVCEDLTATIGKWNIHVYGQKIETFYFYVRWKLDCSDEMIPNCNGRLRARALPNASGATFVPTTLNVDCKGGPRCEDTSGRKDFKLRVPRSALKAKAPVKVKIEITRWCQGKKLAPVTYTLAFKGGTFDRRASDLNGDGKADG